MFMITWCEDGDYIGMGNYEEVDKHRIVADEKDFKKIIKEMRLRPGSKREIKCFVLEERKI